MTQKRQCRGSLAKTLRRAACGQQDLRPVDFATSVGDDLRIRFQHLPGGLRRHLASVHGWTRSTPARFKKGRLALYLRGEGRPARLGASTAKRFTLPRQMPKVVRLPFLNRLTEQLA